jgi:hypothetical protein
MWTFWRFWQHRGAATLATPQVRRTVVVRVERASEAAVPHKVPRATLRDPRTDPSRTAVIVNMPTAPRFDKPLGRH